MENIFIYSITLTILNAILPAEYLHYHAAVVAQGPQFSTSGYMLNSKRSSVAPRTI